MGVHDLGYRPWTGQRIAGFWRLFVIAEAGVRRTWTSTWLRRTLMVAWLPTFWFAFGLFAWEQSVLYPNWRRAIEPFFEAVPANSDLADVLSQYQSDPELARHAVWSWLLLSFFRYSQAIIMILVVGFVAPGLISQDIRSRAFLLYFSRPIQRWQYILGKLMTVWFYLGAISTVPAFSLYALGIILSPDISVIQFTWDIPLRILAASFALMVPTSLLAVCFSSLTQESRYASFAWFAVWILGWFTFGLLTTLNLWENQPLDPRTTNWANISLYHLLGRVQSWIFGFADGQATGLSAIVLVALTIATALITYRKVGSPMRV